MMDKIILFSLNKRYYIITITIILSVIGIYNLSILPLDAVPDITNNQVQVITTSPSLSALEMELQVNLPLEQNLRTIPGIKELRSIARNGLSVITVVFPEHTDIYLARQQINEKINMTMNELPEGLNPYAGPISTGLGEIYQYILMPQQGYEEKYSLIQLREIQDWVVRRQILGTEGVADVSSFGGYIKQFEIKLNLSLLNSLQIGIGDVLDALNKNNKIAGSAYIEKDQKAYTLRADGRYKNADDLKNIVIKSEGNVSYRLGQIAEIGISGGIRYGAMVYTSEGGKQTKECVGGIVLMLKGENSRKVVQNIKNKINEIQKTLPEGLKIVPFLDRTKMVNSTISTVKKNLLEGAAVVIMVLILLFGSLKYGFLVASVIPVSMLNTFSLMNLFRISGNLMSLGALDFGLIVDGAVIVAENIVHRIYQLKLKNPRDKEKKSIILKSTSEMMNISFFGQLIIITVYVPVLLFSGIEGKMFLPMALTVIFALVSSFILSITYIPAIMYLLNFPKKTKIQTFSENLIETLRLYYIKIFLLFIKNIKLCFTLIIALVIFCIWLFTKLGGEFIPELEEGDFAIETRLDPGTSLEKTISKCKEASVVLAKHFKDEVEMVISKIGNSEIPTDPMPLYGADLIVKLKPIEQWKKAHSFNELSEKMSATLNGLKDAEFGIQYPVQMRFNELLAGSKQEVVCKIFGENYDTLNKISDGIKKIIEKHNKTEGIYAEENFGQPEINIRWRFDKMNIHNIHFENLYPLILALNSGIYAGKIYENERNFDIYLRTDGNVHNLNNILNFIVMNENNQPVYLHQIADVSINRSPGQIQHENGTKRKIVGFNIRGSDIESVIDEIRKNIDRELKLPRGYYIKFGGTYENLLSAKKQLMVTVPIVMVIIFLLLYIAFKNFKDAALILICIPLSVCGGILFLYFRDISFSISAGVGFIALFGVAVLNGVVLIHEFKTINNSDHRKIFTVIRGIKNRFRPVITTSLVAALGFLPMFFNTGVGANIQRPLATVVIGGLITSTILTLFVIPSLYLFIQNKNNRLKFSALPCFIFILFFICQQGISQTGLSWSACLDSMNKNNSYMKSLYGFENANQLTSKQIALLSPIGFDYQYGNFNSAYIDRSIGISCKFPNLYTYSVEKTLAENKKNLIQLNIQTEKKELKAMLIHTYFYLLVQQRKLYVFNEIKQLAEKITYASLKKFEKGGINLIQKNALSFNAFDIAHTISQLEISISNSKKLLQELTGIQNSDMIINDTLIFDYLNHSNAPIISKRNELILKEQQSKIHLSRSNLMPDFSIGYTIQSLSGYGSDNVFYDAALRFHYFKINISLPIAYQSIINKIRSEKLTLKSLEWKKAFDDQYFIMEINQIKNEIDYYKRKLMDYHTNWIPDALKSINNAKLQFDSGNINITDYFILINEILRIYNSYFETVQKYNELNINLMKKYL
ncbi:MAG: CusA/CzcA family heavy metal efflux RND transporter [Bacteroidia bacterium]|nr:CusA/CzcA family heavy metal efflux RND transporter [Bacteroidia bacterium]